MWSLSVIVAFSLGLSAGRYAEKNKGWAYDIWSSREGWQLKWKKDDQEGGNDDALKSLADEGQKWDAG